LPWIDRPLVTTNLVGGEDGIDDAGLSVQRIIPMLAVVHGSYRTGFPRDSGMMSARCSMRLAPAM